MSGLSPPEVQGSILSLQFSDYPAPQDCVAFDIKTERLTLEGKVIKVSEDGQVQAFQLSKPINPFPAIPASNNSIVVGSIINVKSLEDWQIERLSV